LTIKI